MIKSTGFKLLKYAGVALFVAVSMSLASCGSSSLESSSYSSSTSTTISTTTSTVTSTSTEISSVTSIANVPVTGIVVQGASGATTITTLDGTLQMSAIVTPDNATDDSVVWSVVNGTGEATISVTGLLMAQADGNVTVRATSVSDPSVFGWLVVAISNQRAESKVSLLSSIADANINKDSVVVSVDGSDVLPSNQWVSAEVKNVYVAAIASAQLVADSTVATQAAVDEAVTVLAMATSIFNNAKAFGIKVIEGINLGTAINYAVLAKSAITTGGASVITGDVGISPAAATYMTGFSLVADSSGTFAKSTQVIGSTYAANYTSPTPEVLTTAVSDMEAAYNVGMEIVPSDFTEIYGGDLSGHTLETGVYKWSNNVVINSDVTISGSASDVWVFQISGMLTQAADVDIVLADGALADNIYWLVGEAVTIGAGAHMEGVILAQTAITMGVNSSIDGRLLAQTAITLSDTIVTSSIVAPTEINVQATGQASAITVNGGTLQMSASFLPANVSNHSVIWSVSNDTGEASISPSGLLTAISDGMVIVKATAANYPTVFGTKTITISNQAAESKTALIDAVAAASLNKVSVAVSVDGSDIMPEDKWVTAAVLTDYEAAIATAQLVVDDVEATQPEVDDALSALDAASSTFNAEKAFGTYVEEVMQTIDLGVAGDFAVLAKAAISTTGATYVTGDLGVSPAAATYLTGFDLVADATNTFSTSIYASGQLLAADYAEPTPTYLTTAVANMETAYTYGMGLAPDATELFAGNLSGQTLVGGVYKWSNDVLINAEFTISGSATDTWIFQISGKLTQAENINVTLIGGALPENIFWIVADTVAIGVGAHLAGTVMTQVDISMGTGSTIDGRLLAQTAVSLDSTIVTMP